jgi:hypothetical protein
MIEQSYLMVLLIEAQFTTTLVPLKIDAHR